MSGIGIYVTMGGMIEQYIKKINQSLAALLADVNRRYGLSRISPELFRYSKDFVLRKGKRIRPLLFVLGYQGYTSAPSAGNRGLFTSAAAIELLHDYMLIHDDVIDKSNLRRGKPTLHRLFDQKIKLADHAKIGPELAIVAGDILFAVAIEALLSIREQPQRKELALRKLVATAAHTGAGEFIDIVYGHERLEDLTEKDVFLTYTLKTAKYTFECPLVMGATLAGAKRPEVDKLSALGIAAGQAFQLYDDFLDLFASQKIIGKSVLSDLSEAKKTLLTIRAYQNLGTKQRRRFKVIFEKKNKTYADLKIFRRLIVESGSYRGCLGEMQALQNKAIGLCRRLTMKKAYQKALLDLIEKLSPSRTSHSFSCDPLHK